jgi:hypothetical protein
MCIEHIDVQNTKSVYYACPKMVYKKSGYYTCPKMVCKKVCTKLTQRWYTKKWVLYTLKHGIENLTLKIHIVDTSRLFSWKHHW